MQTVRSATVCIGWSSVLSTPLSWCCCAALCLSPARALADDEAPAREPIVNVHAFVSQGFIKTTDNNYLAESRKGSFEFSEVGINFSRALTDDLRVGLQLFAHDIGPIGNYNAQLDWFHLDYRFRDWLGIRAGRTKLPFGLYNEANDIDSGRVPILLPQSLYPLDHRDYLLAQTGGELYGTIPIGQAGAVEYRAYGGTLFLRADKTPGPILTQRRLVVPYIFGGRVMWITPLDGLQLGGSGQALELDSDYTVAKEIWPVLMATKQVPANFDGALHVKFRVKLWVGSIEYAAHDLLLAAEYGRWIGEFDSSIPGVFPPRTVNERYYALASYRVRPWFTPGVYYSVYYPNLHHRDGRENYQHDLAITFRYDLTPNWLFKIEGHAIHGTAALDSELNGGKALKDLNRNWGALLLKTTAYF